MTWRWFYSTEESDTALKAILDASKFSKEYTRNENALTDGVFEYKVWIEQDSEFLLLSAKVDAAKIRALSSPERVAQFGNIRPDNYFDTTKYAAGCDVRDTDTLANMISYISKFPTGVLIAQRDIDIQGSASLGTVALTLSSQYKKTYNLPVNGSVSDRTLVKAVTDSTTPAQTQTNATCNQAMFDFARPTVRRPSANLEPGVGTSTEFIDKMTDGQISILSTAKYIKNQTVIFDFEALFAVSRLILVWKTEHTTVSQSSSMTVDYSSNGVSWTNISTHSYGTGAGTYTTDYSAHSLSNISFRYLRLSLVNTNSTIYAWIRELIFWV